MEVGCRVEMLLRILYGSIYNSWAPLDGYLQTVKLNSGSTLLNKPVACNSSIIISVFTIHGTTCIQILWLSNC